MRQRSLVLDGLGEVANVEVAAAVWAAHEVVGLFGHLAVAALADDLARAGADVA